jgi:tRNA (cmo5U34)-methyltransferase
VAREYDSSEKVAAYLGVADTIPHRSSGEAVLLDELPPGELRVLDLGCGDGRLLELVLEARPGSTGIAVDASPPMIAKARERFAGRPVDVLEHDLGDALPPEWGRFDAVVSSFAIHHVPDARKRELYGEAHALLVPGGVFCNLEHVSSPTAALHERFIRLLGSEDETNLLLDVETQLRWLRELGFEDVDCRWKWLELALLAGVRPRA